MWKYGIVSLGLMLFVCGGAQAQSVNTDEQQAYTYLLEAYTNATRIVGRTQHVNYMIDALYYSQYYASVAALFSTESLFDPNVSNIAAYYAYYYSYIGLSWAYYELLYEPIFSGTDHQHIILTYLYSSYGAYYAYLAYQLTR